MSNGAESRLRTQNAHKAGATPLYPRHTKSNVDSKRVKKSKKPKVIIIDNNPVSIAAYMEEFGEI